jgi:hypothetical protein
VVSADSGGPEERKGGHREAVIRAAAASPRRGPRSVPRLRIAAAFRILPLLLKFHCGGCYVHTAVFLFRSDCFEHRFTLKFIKSLQRTLNL